MFNNNCLEEEIEFIRTGFYYQTNYPFWVINKIINEVKEITKVTTLYKDNVS